MNHRTIASYSAILLLAGCTVPKAPGQQGYSGTTPVVANDNPYPNYRYEMNEIGGEYAADLAWNQPQHVSDDVANCYKIKGSGAIGGNSGAQSTRWCLALDYVAFKDNQVATHNYRTPGNPYFSKETTLQRWETYGPKAGFTDAESMFQYMRGTYAFVKPTQVNITNSLRPGRMLPTPGEHLPSLMPTPPNPS